MLDNEILDILSLQEKTKSLPENSLHQATLPIQVAHIVEKKTRDGSKSFLRWEARDSIGELSFNMWDDHPQWNQAKSMIGQSHFLKIKADWSNGKFGLEPKNWHFDPLTADEQIELLEGNKELREQQEKDFQDIKALVDKLGDPRLRELSLLFLNKFETEFKNTAAARTYHHARRGGLIEHVAQMMRTASVLTDCYPELNKDLIITGALFHDCGKLWENRFEDNSFEMPYREIGELLTHIPVGMELVNSLWKELIQKEEAKEWKTLEPTNEKVRLHLLHLIASHHGEIEFGSPVTPKTPEAQILHYIDNIDAKMEMFRKGYQTTNELDPGIHDVVRPIGKIITPLPEIRN